MGSLARQELYTSKRTIQRAQVLEEGRRRRAEKKLREIERINRREVKVDVAATRIEKNEKMEISFLDKVFLIGGICVICAVMFAIVFVSAFCADIQADINKTDAQIVSANEDIKALKVKLESTRTLSTIEQTAINKLNMHYPDEGQMVYIDGNIKLPSNFSDMIRARVYQ